MASLHALSLKVFLISTLTSVLFTALGLQVVKHVFLTWKLCLSYFKPHPRPYLFLVFNTIIISIAVSTMFHHRSHPTSLPPDPIYVAKPMRLPVEEEEEELEEEEEEEEDPPLERTETPPAPALEDVWKAITEGRETKASKKWETFSERNTVVCGMSMRIAPSPSLDELNRRVEAFIRNFYEEMRLQKLQSLAESKHEDCGETLR